VQIGDLRARGFGVADTETAHLPYAELTLGPAAAVPLLPWLYAGIGAEGAFAVARPSFHMRNLDELYRPALFAVRGWAGLEIRFR
jgi:hypothetical protein